MNRFIAIIVAVGLLAIFLSIPQMTYSASTQIAYGNLIEGSIDSAGKGDTYTFQAQAGDTIIIRMNRISGSMNPYLELFAPNGSRITSQGSPFPYDRAQILDQSLASTGTYTIFASDNGGNGAGNYWLSLQCWQHVKANAETISYDSYIEKSVNPNGDMDAYTFSGSAGDTVIIRMCRTSGSFEPRLELFDPDDNPITEKWDYNRVQILSAPNNKSALFAPEFLQINRAI